MDQLRPVLPIDYLIGEFDGGQGSVRIYWTVEEPDDFLSEDEVWDLTEEVDKYIHECKKLIDKDDFDVYSYLHNLCESIPTYGPNLRFI